MKRALLLLLFTLLVGSTYAQQVTFLNRVYNMLFYRDSGLVVNVDFTDSLAPANAINRDFDSIVIVSVSNIPIDIQVWADDEILFTGDTHPYKLKGTKVRLKTERNEQRIYFRIFFYYSYYSVGLDDVSIKDIEVYNYDKKLVLSNTGASRTFDVNLYNGLGQKVQEVNQLIHGKQEFDLEVPTGIYTAVIREGERTIYKKILVH